MGQGRMPESCYPTRPWTVLTPSVSFLSGGQELVASSTQPSFPVAANLLAKASCLPCFPSGGRDWFAEESVLDVATFQVL